MVNFLDRDRRSNLVLPLRFGQGNNPPRRPNFAQNMHPNKRCRRSLARQNRSAPEYHDVDHGVAVGWPRRFLVIAHIAFVGGMGGWCCRTWRAVVFTVVLRTHEKRTTKKGCEGTKMSCDGLTLGKIIFGYTPRVVLPPQQPFSNATMEQVQRWGEDVSNDGLDAISAH
jgi:hypothetical protein